MYTYASNRMHSDARRVPARGGRGQGGRVALLRCLREHALTIAVIFVLIVGQVLCELSIPSFTSDIVDVGIQQQGVTDAVPRAMRAETLERVCALLDDDDASLVRGAFSPREGDSSVVELEDAWSTGESREELAAVLEGPEATLAVESDGIAESGEPLATGESASSASSDSSEGVAAQRAAQFVLAEYETVGVDVGAIQTGYLLLTGLKMLGLVACSLCVTVAGDALSSRVAAFVARDLRKRVYESVLAFSEADVRRFGAASLITRCTNDVQLVQTAISSSLRMVFFAPIMGVSASVMVALRAPDIAWVVAVAVAAVLCVVIALLVVTLPKFRSMQDLVDRVNLVSRESITGVSVVRAFGREEAQGARFDRANSDLMGTSLFTSRAMAFMMPTTMLLMNATSVAIVWFGSFDVQAGALQVGDLIAFINYAMHACMSFMTMTMFAVVLPRAIVAAGRLEEVASFEPTVADPASPARPAAPSRGEIRFEGVSFRFPDADADSLRDVTFTVAPGTTTAVVGSTGSGKSTLARLVPRFFDATAGRVLFDGVDVRSMSQADLRSRVSYVPQRSVLFGGTVRSNIAFSDPAMPLERVRAAADAACATEFVERMPGGFDAPVSQGGTNVSGGQRQRLAIARALAADALVYVFDDSFSALDAATDAAVRANLRRFAPEASFILVAQRVSTVVDADQIVVLDEGRVAGVGNHRELMAGCPVYREIASSQLSEAELAALDARFNESEGQEGGGSR